MLITLLCVWLRVEVNCVVDISLEAVVFFDPVFEISIFYRNVANTDHFHLVPTPNNKNDLNCVPQ